MAVLLGGLSDFYKHLAVHITQNEDCNIFRLLKKITNTVYEESEKINTAESTDNLARNVINTTTEKVKILM